MFMVELIFYQYHYYPVVASVAELFNVQTENYTFPLLDLLLTRP